MGLAHRKVVARASMTMVYCINRSKLSKCQIPSLQYPTTFPDENTQTLHTLEIEEDALSLRKCVYENLTLKGQRGIIFPKIRQGRHTTNILTRAVKKKSYKKLELERRNESISIGS